MIDKVVKAIIENINDYIKLKFKVEEPKVIFSNLVNQDGSVPPANNNKIICSLINIEQEQIRSAGAFMTSGKSFKNPPINIDLYLMFSSSYVEENYEEGLRFLSLAINFFQGKSVFTPQNTPKLPETVQKITFKMYSLDMSNLSHLWGAIGAKYMPSVIYQLRTIAFFENIMLDEVSNVDAPNLDLK